MRRTFSLCAALSFLLLASPALAQTDWIKFVGNPVLDLGANGTWEDTRVVPGQVVVDGAVYRMWYTGWDGTPNDNFRIGYATSPDGKNWTKHPGNPILDKGGPGEWDSNGIAVDAVLKENGTYKMWCSGGDGSRGCIGYATSADGVVWAKYGGNPVLEPDPGQWDGTYAHWCTVIKDGSEY